MKDKGMKWVIVADVLGIIVIGLLIWASRIDNEIDAQRKAEQERLAEVPNYDFDLQLTPQNCEGVSGVADVVLITDANYMDFTRVAINSAKKTKCPASKYNFHVMTLDVSEADVSALKAMEEENVTVSVLPQDEVDLFYIRDTHVSKTSLLKYYIAKALPELDKVLYIDSDVLVLRDLNNVYNTDIEDKYLAVVKDPSWFFENMHVVELNLDERGFYFNSGVMLMNLKKFREDGLEAKLEDYTNNNFRTYMDQDALNVVVGDDVVLLPFEANAMNFFFEHNDLNIMGQFYDRSWQNYEEVFAPVTILHFASSKKPLGREVSETEFFRMLQRLWYKYYTGLPPLK
ncbi:MAG: glycosyltransferase family 8 protein [Acetobacter sp.]|nr:glycosyltransferase family 8 protein [Acetobacter sp.]